MPNYEGEQNIRHGENLYVGTKASVFLKSRPPLGVKPKWLHDEERREELKFAIERHLAESEEIPVEWVEEYNELTHGGGVKRG